jgi:tRNA 2-selenouridine synthase
MPHPQPPGAEAIRALLHGTDAIVDVRSPAEYARGHIAGAVNVPLFSDGERAEVGIVYKQQGKPSAIERGLDLVGAKLTTFISAFTPYRSGRLLIYCARGGMRSRSVAALLGSLGYRVDTLPGGYKAYRNFLLAELERLVPPRMIVIHGGTGVGKTLLLRRLENTLDLEDLAQHRSSLFGGVNLKPRTQQQFEAELLRALERLDLAYPVWVEGESRKVGNVTLPESLRLAMKAAPCVLVTASLETRVRRIIAEYAGSGGTVAPEALAALEAALRKLTPFFGKARMEQLLGLLHAGDLRPLVRTLLEEHYDPRYAHAMRHYQYLATISSEDLDAAAAALRRLVRMPRLASTAQPGPGRSSAFPPGESKVSPLIA